MPANAQSSEIQLVALCPVDAVQPDAPARVVVGNQAYAVFCLDGQFYVTQDQCTHGPGSLAEGFVMGTEIECPFHQGRFDIRTGAPTAAPCIQALRTWKARVVDGQVLIDPQEHSEAGA